MNEILVDLRESEDLLMKFGCLLTAGFRRGAFNLPFNLMPISDDPAEQLPEMSAWSNGRRNPQVRAL
ncbi:hypothetical protein [Microbispora amethystogenes]|uniref:hypothetical protein n=1 Tax=Microbispora amethystogenes TaxID=1427754 RepID=UPI0019539000|nr:hypothetical protein [Microbispora amethystogenes]